MSKYSLLGQPEIVYLTKKDKRVKLRDRWISSAKATYI